LAIPAVQTISYQLSAFSADSRQLSAVSRSRRRVNQLRLVYQGIEKALAVEPPPGRLQRVTALGMLTRVLRVRVPKEELNRCLSGICPFALPSSLP
jgi:hypothetical protein